MDFILKVGLAILMVLYLTLAVMWNSARKLTPQDYIDSISRSEIVIDGHDYILFESGERMLPGYSFNLEHNIECKKCISIFD